ncbi:hypothetical protein GYMLUDRAFT_832279 [Collybiopsis luxurians FD-317 M1]|uniref:Uncharacterized protein n=1 Tax=Collybiopsis luxurians FD-317 M1 TaxID=944289 RepID=A0A0D0BLX6_9AGAR|nr:hypothetical protein GYMLUDRAFT_832279 [Collybiopsis luxurians FD-317 M1]
MLAVTIFMYCLSILHLAFSLKINLVALFDQKTAQAESASSKSLETTENIFACTPIAAETLNCILGDSIVIWRTWMLWNRNWQIIFFPCALLSGVVVAGAFLVRAMFLSLAGPSLFNTNTTAAVVTFCVLTTMINVYAIIAIGYRAWKHSRLVSGAGGLIIGGLSGRYSTIFLIFVESGFIYSIVPILMMILFSTSDNSVFIIIGILAQMTGIYPTAIIVLICLQLTQYNHITRVGSAIDFRGHSQRALTEDSAVLTASNTSSRPDAVHEVKHENFEVSRSIV